MQVITKSKDGIKNVNLNRRKAIHERCLNCTGWIPKEVADCKTKECPIHSYRLGKGNQNAAKRQKAIRAYCMWCMNGQVGEISKCPSIDCPLRIYRKGGVDKSMGNFMQDNFNKEPERSASQI